MLAPQTDVLGSQQADNQTIAMMIANEFVRSVDNVEFWRAHLEHLIRQQLAYSSSMVGL